MIRVYDVENKSRGVLFIEAPCTLNPPGESLDEIKVRENVGRGATWGRPRQPCLLKEELFVVHWLGGSPCFLVVGPIEGYNAEFRTEVGVEPTAGIAGLYGSEGGAVLCNAKWLTVYCYCSTKRLPAYFLTIEIVEPRLV